MHVRLAQHAVGQGGFLTGQLGLGSSVFRWAYDCGSNQSDPLQREISVAAGEGSIAVLFLSHLDSDHISGLDRLLASTTVVEVVLPYLEDSTVVLSICNDLDKGRLSGLFLDFADNPAAWLIGRGAQRVTFVRIQPDGLTPEDGTPIPPETPPGAEGPIVAKWSKPPVSVAKISGKEVQELQPGSMLFCVAQRRVLNWVLVPYAHEPTVQRASAFLKLLRQTFGKRSLKSIAREARTEAGRTRLRACYDALWQNHNLVSMSLYAGPANSPHTVIYPNEGWSFAFRRHVGWLCTGDANLSGQRRRTALIEYYRHFLSQIGALVLPHHGSADSFHPHLLSSLPNVAVAIAAAGRNPYGHPHPGVRAAVNTVGLHFIQVKESPRTTLRMRVELQ